MMKKEQVEFSVLINKFEDAVRVHEFRGYYSTENDKMQQNVIKPLNMNY